ncbi:hypothetical protein KIN20_034227 [Parelaphostrongylus tenuis]|uniref:Uncharacterized protein n=1 Tax=Parelaphostrongylus tenuis TaxID=148309 RepID=A0AAD5R959_PARTN|nr:hypothetical protein KIN20_034227 [Parelaphostrongylus tenuis]
MEALKSSVSTRKSSESTYDSSVDVNEHHSERSGMAIFTNMVEHLTNFFVISLLATIFTVLGCEVMPAGQSID